MQNVVDTEARERVAMERRDCIRTLIKTDPEAVVDLLCGWEEEISSTMP